MPMAQHRKRTARIRPAWIVWGMVSFALSIYMSMAQIASHTTTARLQLEPTNVVQIRLFRLFDDTLDFRLKFKGNGRDRRPELGSYRSTDKKDGLSRYQPGAEVQFLVSGALTPPQRYEAIPLGNLYRPDENTRRMTANLSIQPGVYRWPPPPSTPVTHLHAGFNLVRFEVASVGEPFAGETVSLEVLPPLGFKQGKASAVWLWWGLLWPFILLPQVLWGLLLCPGGLRRREAQG